MRIFEYHPGIGTFSSGIEKNFKHKVVQVQNISSLECSSYNISHLHQFTPNNSNFINYDSLKKHDFAILKPDFGISITQKRFNSLKMDELYSCLNYIAKYRPKIVIIITPPHVIKSLNYNHSYVTDGFDMVSKDIVIQALQSCDYMAWQLVIDQVQCGVPMYYPVNFYIGIDQSLGDVRDTESPSILYGSGSDKLPYHTVYDAISDLGPDQDAYLSQPINAYQLWCREDETKLRNHIPKELNSSDLKRALFTRPADIGSNFYLPNGIGFPCHPSYSFNRAFTIREGMRLHGIPDYIYLSDRIHIKQQAYMVHEQISPLTAINLYSMIKPYI